MEEKAVEVCNTFDSTINYSQGIIDRKLIRPPFHLLSLSLSTNLTNQVIPPMSRITLDVIATTVLGVPLSTLDAAVPFHESYQIVFDPSTWGQILSAVNVVVPVRWLSVGENGRFNGAIARLHWAIRGVIRRRIADVAGEKNGMEVREGAGERKDILTRMVQESRGMGLQWTEEDIIGHVSAPRWKAFRIMANGRKGSDIHGGGPRNNFEYHCLGGPLSRAVSCHPGPASRRGPRRGRRAEHGLRHHREYEAFG